MESGQLFEGRYLLNRRIGIGGMGEVWRADDIERGRVVAIKQLHEHLAKRTLFVARFLREARAAMMTCFSPHIVEVLDIEHRPGSPPYLVMEYLEGETLSKLLHRMGSLPRALAIDIALQTACALAEVHQQGVIHRDIKPGNLFVTHAHNGKTFVKILDFGVAKFLRASDDDDTLTGTGVIIGTVEYMPPEQIFGSRDLDQRVDIYALGKVLYHMLSGQQPRPAPDMVPNSDDSERTLYPLRRLRPEIDDRLEHVVFKAMARDRTKRFADMDAMALALETCLVKSLCAPEEDKDDTLMTPPPPECMEVDPEAALDAPTTLDNVFQCPTTGAETNRVALESGSLSAQDTERHPFSLPRTTPSVAMESPISAPLPPPEHR